jgi:hypothetical protein
MDIVSNRATIAHEPTALEWAYIAGFFDGEGCIRVRRLVRTGDRSPRLELCLTLTQKDRGVLDRVCEMIGRGSVQSISRQRVLHRWQIRGHRDIEYVAARLVPFSIVKRPALLAAMELLKRHEVWGPGRRRLPAEEVALRDALANLISPRGGMR